MKTFMARSEDFEKKWYLIDAEGKSVGRVATRIATILRGKQKPEFTPHADLGDFVVVVNADKVVFTGDKLSQKVYYRHSGYPGGIKSVTAGRLLKEKPEEVIRKAVWGMLPKNRWQKKLITRVKIYRGGSHPHGAQQPEVLEV
jgi:large subunit ribosomal protein L13